MEEEEGSAWSMLGRSFHGIAEFDAQAKELTDRLDALERLVLIMQGELMMRLETLEQNVGGHDGRLLAVEEGRPVESVLDVMTQDELNEIAGTNIGMWPSDDSGNFDDEMVTVVPSGFVVPPPRVDIPDDEPLESLEPSPPTGETEQPRLSPEAAAEGIVGYISEHGGIPNADWKRKGLIPQDCDAAYRKEVGQLLTGQHSMNVWRRNNAYHFYYPEGDDVDEAYFRATGARR